MAVSVIRRGHFQAVIVLSLLLGYISTLPVEGEEETTEEMVEADDMLLDVPQMLYNYSKLSTFHTIESCQEWLDSLEEYEAPAEDDVACPTTHDTVSCIPATKGGIIVKIKCPPFKGLDHTKFAWKLCQDDGSWENSTHYADCYIELLNNQNDSTNASTSFCPEHCECDFDAGDVTMTCNQTADNVTIDEDDTMASSGNDTDSATEEGASEGEEESSSEEDGEDGDAEDGDKEDVDEEDGDKEGAEEEDGDKEDADEEDGDKEDTDEEEGGDKEGADEEDADEEDGDKEDADEEDGDKEGAEEEDADEEDGDKEDGDEEDVDEEAGEEGDGDAEKEEDGKGDEEEGDGEDGEESDGEKESSEEEGDAEGKEESDEASSEEEDTGESSEEEAEQEDKKKEESDGDSEKEDENGGDGAGEVIETDERVLKVVDELKKQILKTLDTLYDSMSELTEKIDTLENRFFYLEAKVAKVKNGLDKVKRRYRY